MAKKKANFGDDNYQFNPNDDLNIFYNLTLDDEQKASRLVFYSR